MTTSFQLFSEKPFGQFIGGKETGYKNKIRNENEETILNTDKEKYIEYIESEYSITPYNIYFDKKTLDSKTRNGRKEYYLYFPFSGNIDLLQYRPNEHNGWATEAIISEGEPEFSVQIPVDQSNIDHREVQTSIDEIESKVRENSDALLAEIDEFNEVLSNGASALFAELKERYLKDRDVLEDLDIDIREREDRSDTFVIDPPEQRKEITVEEPPEPDTSPVEKIPTLSDGAYQDILEVINDIGQGFEKSPRLFLDKKEEDLRDFILFFLQMNFVGEASGETFNNSGKTDILLRHKGDNVFVGECAIWNGEKYFSGKIDQLDQYLTWRDTKAAIILFSRTESMTDVHRQIQSGAESHPRFKELIGKQEESWYQYRFHFPEDRERDILLAVLVFHLRDAGD